MKFYTNVPHFNTENGDKIIYPFSPPIFQTIIDKKYTVDFLEEGRKLTKKDDDWNHKLAGNLKNGRSYHYKEDYLLKMEPFLISYVEKFFNGLYEQYGQNYDGINKLMNVQDGRRQYRNGNLRLDTMWINFSQKNDFNPPHTHSGILSFVLFCKVPQEIFKEQCDSNAQRAGELNFQYGEQITPIMGNEYPIKPFENLLFIFPNELKHFVPSYYIDVERISVSGNFILT